MQSASAQPVPEKQLAAPSQFPLVLLFTMMPCCLEYPVVQMGSAVLAGRAA